MFKDVVQFSVTSRTKSANILLIRIGSEVEPKVVQTLILLPPRLKLSKQPRRETFKECRAAPGGFPSHLLSERLS